MLTCGRNCGKNGFEQLSEDPEMARVFDDAMTDQSEWLGAAIAAGYDFGAWGSLMDVGGGSGMLLAAMLRTHPGLDRPVTCAIAAHRVSELNAPRKSWQNPW